MFKIHYGNNLNETVADYKLPDQLPFGVHSAPIMSYVDFENGQWGDLNIVPYGPITILPTAKVLHYGQEIFEGMKAYKCDGVGPFLFRPSENWKRLNQSAIRMAMPEIPEDLFNAAVEKVVSYCAPMIPQKSGESLYLRPFMFGTDETLGVKPSEKYKFMVIASPSGSYFAGGAQSVSVLIERHSARAFPGGTGFAKTGGNYAASLLSAAKAKKLHFDQTLWLDGISKEYVEEMSGMNFCAVINGELITPKINDTILEGITRKSILQMAADLNIKASEQKLSITDLIAKIKSEECTECFACGTAAIVTPIKYLGEETGEKYHLKNADGLVSNKIRKALLDVQEGRSSDKYNWVKKVEI